jgi:hypothetical protein
MNIGQDYKKRGVRMAGNSENNKNTKARRGRGRPFPKGVSGNPGGRKPLPPEFKKALEELTPDALALLGKAVRDALLGGGKVTPQALEAAKYLINREHGAPAHTATIKTEPPVLDWTVNLIPPGWLVKVPDGEEEK